MRKKIMILGAGIYQVPLILKAKEMGLYTLVTSYPGPYPGFALADECLYLDTRDEAGILKAAREKAISGICTTGTDVAIRALGHTAELLQLPGLSEASAKQVTDKLTMREVFQNAGVKGTIPFCRVTSLSEAENFFHSQTSPIMLKATDSSGSRGIVRADSLSEVKEAYEAARSATRLPYVLAEKYVAGEEIGVDGFVLDGEVKLLLPHKKFLVTAGHTTLPGGHAFPYVADETLLKTIGEAITEAIRATGLDNCAFNADVMISGQQPYILEIGGRCGATCIPELISLYCGFDYYRKILEAALGEKPVFSYQKTTPCMAKLLFSPVDGVITAIDSEKLAVLQKEGGSFSLDYKTGDSIKRVKNGTDRIGQVILATSSEPELDLLVNRIQNAIEIDGMPLSLLWNNLPSERSSPLCTDGKNICSFI